jgi:chromosome segregation ATPase
MSNTDGVNPKALNAKVANPKFSSYLRAIETDRLNAANESKKEKPLLLQNRIREADYSVVNARLLQATGILVSFMWLAGASFYVQRTVGWSNVSSLMPHELGGFLAGILTPIALFWMIAAFILRSNDVKMYAEALRSEIQAMIFPSEEADRRVNNDIERLIRQTSEMSKATKIMLSTIAEAREGLKGQIVALNGTSDQTLDRLSQLGKSMSERTSEVTFVGQTLDRTIKNIENGTKATAEWMAKLQSANEQIGQQTTMVNQSTQNTEQAVTRLSDVLRERLEDLTAQREGFRLETDKMQEKAALVAGALTGSTNKLYEFTDDALDKAKLIETRLQGHASSLEQVLKLTAAGAQEIATKTEEATSRLQVAQDDAIVRSEKLEQVIQNAVKRLIDKSQEVSQQTEQSINNATQQMTERSQFAVHQAQNNLTEATTRMIADVDQVSERAKTISGDMLKEVSSKVADTSAAFVYIQKQIQALVTLFDQRKTHLDEAGAGARHTAETLQKTLQIALDKVRDTSQALQDSIANVDVAIQKPVALLETSISKVYLKAGDMGQLLTNRTNALTQSAQQIGTQMTAMHEKLHGKGQEVALLAGKIAGHLQNVTKELDTQNTTLDQRTQKSVATLQGLSALQDGVITSIDKLGEAAQTTQQHIQTLHHSHVAMSDEAAKSHGALGQISDRLINISGDTVNKIKTTLENLTLLEADYHRLSDSSVENIDRIGKAYRQTLDTTQNDTAKANDSLVSMHQQLEQQAEKTGLTIQQNIAKVAEAATSLYDTAHQIDNTAAQTVAKIATVQQMGQTANISLQQLNAAAQGFDNKIQETANTVSVHVNTMDDAVSKLQDMTGKAVDTIIEKSQHLEQQTDSHVSHLERSFDHASGFSTKLREYLNELRTDSEGLENRLGQSVTRLLSHGNQIDVSTTNLIDKINQAQTELLQQGQSLRQTGDGVLERLQAATQHIGDKAAALEAAAQLAQKQAEELRSQESKLKRDAFFSSTKFVVESLHSLALDFTRLLDGELPEKTWKSYRQGDTASFTRRLLNVRDEETQNKIKSKFADDHEFRTYVQRYLRQFEEIYDQAAGNDHADLLTSVFMTSDVGKLYKFLCTVLDRESRGPDAAKLAA